MTTNRISTVLSSFRFLLYSVLRKFVQLMIRSQVVPQEFVDNKTEIPTCYVFRTKSLLDIIVADCQCIRQGRPRPIFSENTGGTQSRSLFIDQLGFFQKRKADSGRQGFFELAHAVIEGGSNYRVVPVSVFWGLKPSKKDKRNLLRLLFFDELNGGILQRLMLLLFNGRRVSCHFGEPIFIKDQHKVGLSSSETARKIWRVLKVHFRRRREAVLGPILYDRQQLIKGVLSSEKVLTAIEQEALRSKRPKARVEELAYRYCDEIAAHYSHNTVRLFELLLSWVCKKLFDRVEIYHESSARASAQTYVPIYVPCHRSHFDYLLLPFALRRIGLMPPHTAGGVNLNFWPVGPLLRRGGALFLRRRFAGNRLYGAVFAEYIHSLLASGYPFSFYPEGGRSRTGLLLPAKKGLFSIITEIPQKKISKPLAFIPVYIGYDKTVESRSYLKELRGRSKKSESWRQLIKARRIFRSRFGCAYISFGKAIPLDDFSERSNQEVMKGHTYCPEKNGDIGYIIMSSINNNMVVSPTGLVSLIMFSTTNYALAEADLVRMISILFDLQRESSGNSQIQTLSKDPDKIIGICQSLGILQEFTHQFGSVYFIDSKDMHIASYSRNNILPCFAIVSVIAALLYHHDSTKFDDLCSRATDIIEFIREDLFLLDIDSREKIVDLVAANVAALTALGLLERDSGTGIVRRPDMLKPEFSYLRMVGNFVRPRLEFYSVLLTLIQSHARDNVVKESSVEQEYKKNLERIRLLHGFDISESLQDINCKKIWNLLKVKGCLDRKESDHFLLSDGFSRTKNAFDLFLHRDLSESLNRASREA